MKKFFTGLFVLVALFLSACQMQLWNGKASFSFKLPSVSRARAAAEEITLNYSIDCFPDGSETAKYSETGLSGETVTIDSVEPGSYKIVAKAWDSEKTDVILYQGETTAAVIAGENAAVSITLKYVGPEEEDLPEEIVITLPDGKSKVVLTIDDSKDGMILKASTTTAEGVTVKNYYWMKDGTVLKDSSGADKNTLVLKNENGFYSYSVIVEFSDGSYDISTFSLLNYLNAMEGSAEEEIDTTGKSEREVIQELYNRSIKKGKIEPVYTKKDELEKGKLNYSLTFFDYQSVCYELSYSEMKEGNGGDLSSLLKNEIKLSGAVYPVSYLADSTVKPLKNVDAVKTDKTQEMNLFGDEGTVKVPVYEISAELDSGWYYLKTDYTSKMTVTYGEETKTSETTGSWGNVFYIANKHETSFAQTEFGFEIIEKSPNEERGTILYIRNVPEALLSTYGTGAFSCDISLVDSNGDLTASYGMYIKDVYETEVALYTVYSFEKNQKYIITLCNLPYDYQNYQLAVKEFEYTGQVLEFEMEKKIDTSGGTGSTGTSTGTGDVFIEDEPNSELPTTEEVESGTFTCGTVSDLSTALANVSDEKYVDLTELTITVKNCTDSQLATLIEAINPKSANKKLNLNLSNTALTTINNPNNKSFGGQSEVNIKLPDSVTKVTFSSFNNGANIEFVQKGTEKYYYYGKNSESAIFSEDGIISLSDQRDVYRLDSKYIVDNSTSLTTLLSEAESLNASDVLVIVIKGTITGTAISYNSYAKVYLFGVTGNLSDDATLTFKITNTAGSDKLIIDSTVQVLSTE